MNPFHPSIERKINHIGNTYEKMFSDTCDMEEEIATFCEQTEPIFKKFTDTNNKLLQIKKEGELSDLEMQEHWKMSDTIAEKTKQYLPLLSDLVYNTKPSLDEIYNFQHQFTKDLQQLSNNKNNKTVSEIITGKIEKQFLSLQQTFITIRQKIDTCKKTVADIENTFSKSHN